jgi:hypothetical protein
MRPLVCFWSAVRRIWRLRISVIGCWLASARRAVALQHLVDQLANLGSRFLKRTMPCVGEGVILAHLAADNPVLACERCVGTIINASATIGSRSYAITSPNNVEWTARATHTGAFRGIPPTGKQLSYAGMNIYCVEGGKIAEEIYLGDRLGCGSNSGSCPRAASSQLRTAAMSLSGTMDTTRPVGGVPAHRPCHGFYGRCG